MGYECQLVPSESGITTRPSLKPQADVVNRWQRLFTVLCSLTGDGSVPIGVTKIINVRQIGYCTKQSWVLTIHGQTR